MGEKLTQKAFNEEMFAAIYGVALTESTVISGLLETALEALEEQGYDVPDYEMHRGYSDPGVDFEDNRPLLKRLNSFTKRFQKLTGYTWGSEVYE